MKQTRYEWVVTRLEPAEAEALIQEKMYFERQAADVTLLGDLGVGVEPKIADHVQYSLDCLNESSANWKTLSVELSRLFAWHMTLHGEKFWLAMYTKYLTLERENKVKRIKAQGNDSR